MVVAGAAARIQSVGSGRIVVNLAVNAADLITAFAAGAKLYLERDTTSAFGSPTVLTSTVLVAGTEQYEFVDTSGTSSSWYRVRVGNTGGTVYADYSDGFQASATLAYATLEELLAILPDSPTAARYPLLTDLLADASALIDARCGRDFRRHPQVSGTESRLYDVAAPGNRLFVFEGLASLTGVDYATLTGGDYTALVAADWYYDPPSLSPEETYQGIILSNVGAISSFYVGRAVVRLTGVFGWATVPRVIKRGTLALAREMYSLIPTGRGSASAAAGFGSSPVPDFLPRATYEAINWGGNRAASEYM